MPRWDSCYFVKVLLGLYAESVEGLALTLNEELAITHYLCVLLVQLGSDPFCTILHVLQRFCNAEGLPVADGGSTFVANK